MPRAARVSDQILGYTSGEHHGHTEEEEHPPCELTGTITSGSPNVFINGKPACTVGDSTSEHDCCGSGDGTISTGSSSVFINGKKACRIGDSVSPHDGTAQITSGSPNVFIGGD